ncbi:MAG: DNA mismatch repair protein MutS [Candidatus Lokiarchaeota archaeon]|nr:DNA mismatch repair protein MutS [Candidatus Lokiarchaeota archaeon]
MTSDWKQLDQNELPEMLKHWLQIKQQYPNYILAYRVGDFLEFMYDDAKKVSSKIGLTLTKRGSEPNRYALAGIPYKAKHQLKHLIKQGETVVIVDHLEDASEARDHKRLVKRGVTQILSPGTVIDDELLEANTNNYLTAICKLKDIFGIAFIDISSGDFFCTEFAGNNGLDDLYSFISRFEPVEAILPKAIIRNAEFTTQLQDLCNLSIKEFDHFAFQYDNASKALLSHFQTQSLEGFGIYGTDAAICSAGALLSFLNETQKTVLPNITKISPYIQKEIMHLDSATQRNLEILRSLRDGTTHGTLISVINRTNTPMGNRMMRKFIVQPLLSKEKIEARLDVVEVFKKDTILRNDVRELLSQIGDIERTISRINYIRTANARNLINLKDALIVLPSITHILGGIDSKPLKSLMNFNDYTTQIQLIESAIIEEPPTTVTEGNIIRPGFDSRVDELRTILKSGKEWIVTYENKLKETLGASVGIKIGFNRILGYYIQITDNAAKSIQIPPSFQKRATLKGSTRYETQELKDIEIKILNAEETIQDVEYELFCTIREEIASGTKQIQEDSYKIAMLDILCGLGEVAAENNYNRPLITTNDKIIIEQGRHPVIEHVNFTEAFIPNNCYIDCDQEQILLITGPNWSGKSTYLRQVALITILAQIGSFVPAISAEIGIVDRVFTRVGASDDLVHGQSTFLMEMNETAQILHYATQQSLVIIDELGRGTSTSDGRAIARAVLERLHGMRVKTLFSTHFHDLTELNLDRVSNYHFLIREEGNNLVFLRQLTPGGTDKSYGIHVASMAGIPKPVIKRSFELVETNYACKQSEIGENDNHEHLTPLSEDIRSSDGSNKPKKKSVQTILFPLDHTIIAEGDYADVIEELEKIDIDTTTPLSALEKLSTLKKKVKKIQEEKS